MQVEWTAHRFSGGALALDLTNTVVLRADALRSFDRFDDPDEIPRFAAAASDFRAQELGGRRLSVELAGELHGRMTGLREAVDRHFRSVAQAGEIDLGAYGAMLGACASGLEGRMDRVGGHGRPFGDPNTPLELEAAVALSALALTALPAGRIRICRNCRWLFVDRSRNASRLWCDMTVCGNRNKARRHYARRRDERGGHAND